ncbi:MAG: hypothetical protein WAN50_03780 [Minisyncoccia bacterium]
MDAANKYAWSNIGGWINFAPANSTVIVTDSAITGYAWSANDGWLNLSPAQGGVRNDGLGHLSGFAWDSATGWVSFNGVTIDSSGKFHGMATGANDYAINFDCSSCDVVTLWRPASSHPSSGQGGGAISPVTGGSLPAVPLTLFQAIPLTANPQTQFPRTATGQETTAARSASTAKNPSAGAVRQTSSTTRALRKPTGGSAAATTTQIKAKTPTLAASTTAENRVTTSGFYIGIVPIPAFVISLANNVVSFFKPFFMGLNK